VLAPQILSYKNWETKRRYRLLLLDCFVLFCFAVLGLEIRAFTVSHSTSPIFVKGFSA
jgi:hypothetical protein